MIRYFQETSVLVLFSVLIFGCNGQVNRESSDKEVLKQPNIIYIMSDDHAKNAISIYGSRLAEIAPTPNIDRIAKEGVLMNNVFVTNSICTPSRAAILTGQYSQLNGVYTLKDDFDNSTNHLGKLMQKAGILLQWLVSGIYTPSLLVLTIIMYYPDKVYITIRNLKK